MIRFACIVGFLVAGCASNTSETCELSTFQAHCDGDSFVHCSQSDVDVGTITVDDCTGQHMTCIAGTGFTGCVYQKQTCVPAMFQPMCVADGAQVVCRSVTTSAAYPIVVASSGCGVDGGR